MNASTSASTADHEFIIVTKDDASTLTHTVSISEDDNTIFDYVVDGCGNPIKSIVQTGTGRWETELTETGIPVFTRELKRTAAVINLNTKQDEWETDWRLII